MMNLRTALVSLSLLAAAGAARGQDGAIVPDKVIPLFNGKDLSGWKADVPAKDKDPNVRDSFIVRDGKLVSLGKPPGHLITTAAYRDYRLQVEYRFLPKNPGNCGVLVHSSRPRALYGMFPASLEVQMYSGNAGDFWCIAENIVVPDMEKRRPRKKGQKYGGNRGDARRILNLTDGSEKPLGEWNAMVIEARGRTIKVWVNGDLVNYGYDCTVDRGQVALQAEGTEVEFRKVEIGPLPAGVDDGWVSLFDGKSLDGWIQKNGTAAYRIEDGAIIGKTKEGSPNSFLCTAKEYGDFELEFEVKLFHNPLNSGVQIRSQTKPAKGDQKFGRVNGPQVEIEASGGKGAEAGYVYGEATGRGWLTPKERLKPRKVFKDGEWNKYRIVAKGSRIQTWINGEPIEDLTDEEIYKTHPKGFIGLQVHGIRKGSGPYEVAWRNIRIRELSK